MSGLKPTVGVVVLGLVVGCSTGSRSSSTATNPNPAGTNPTQPTTTPTGNRFAATDPGVQVGLQLLRNQITPAQAVTAWTAEGVSPQLAKDVLARLPLTAAPGPGTHQDTIVDAYARTTDITVIVPPTAPPAEGYTVVVYLHGLGGNSGHVSGANVAPGAIMVAPTALAPPPAVVYEDASPVPGLDAFNHWWVYRDHAFAARALDWVRERYPVDSNRVILYGASMGGFGTWNIGLRFPDRFAGLVVGAGGISRIEYAVLPDTISQTRSLLENGNTVPSYFAHGALDTIVPVEFARSIDAALTAQGSTHTYIEVATAGHDSSGFTGLQPQILAWYLAARRDPSPPQVAHRSIGDYHQGSFWLEMKSPATGGTVQGSVTGSTVTVTTANGATGATVYLDPALVDVTGTVTVTVDGATILNAVPTPTLDAVAQSFARTRDPQLTYLHAVTTP